MNRHERRKQLATQHKYVSDLPANLTLIPPKDFPPVDHPPLKAWQSRKYMAQLYDEANETYPRLLRLSICRVRIKGDGGWQQNITWEELQAIKRELGYGDWWGVECYPRDRDIVNVANFRHLWLLPEPLDIGWRVK